MKNKNQVKYRIELLESLRDEAEDKGEFVLSKMYTMAITELRWVLEDE